MTEKGSSATEAVNDVQFNLVQHVGRALIDERVSIDASLWLGLATSECSCAVFRPRLCQGSRFQSILQGRVPETNLYLNGDVSSGDHVCLAEQANAGTIVRTRLHLAWRFGAQAAKCAVANGALRP